MQIERVLEYHGCEERPVVTPSASGRYAAAAIVTDRAGDTRTLGVDGDFCYAQEARNEALELAIAWIQQRSVVSERYVRRT
jgi:nicotinamide mononucleotide (NMN) deamidase PncC